MTNSTPHRGWHSRGYLPHFDGSEVIQSITYRLHDALPLEVVEALKQDKRWQDDAAKRKQLETLLDAGHGACFLREDNIATVVEENWQHFDNKRYRLLAWVVMPNHVHVLIEVLEGFPLDQIVKS